jgi:hypothetical protein
MILGSFAGYVRSMPCERPGASPCCVSSPVDHRGCVWRNLSQGNCQAERPSFAHDSRSSRKRLMEISGRSSSKRPRRRGRRGRQTSGEISPRNGGFGGWAVPRSLQSLAQASRGSVTKPRAGRRYAKAATGNHEFFLNKSRTLAGGAVAQKLRDCDKRQ